MSTITVIFSAHLSAFPRDNNIEIIILLVCYICFTLDIIISFFTDKLKPEQENHSFKKIVKHYVCSRQFPLDIIQSIPFVFIDLGSKALNMIRFASVLRYHTVSCLLPIYIDKLLISASQRASLKLFNIIFQLLVLMHIIACVWHAVCDLT